MCWRPSNTGRWIGNCFHKLGNSTLATTQKEYKFTVPRKIRDLLKDLRKAGFSLVPGGKGSHRKFSHPNITVPAIISGHEGDDAKPYLEKHVAEKINESKS
ncbi:MAG: type II toxin-antitoxin system HicA family toxin [Verrucomicrobiota bacterium]